VEALIY